MRTQEGVIMFLSRSGARRGGYGMPSAVTSRQSASYLAWFNPPAGAAETATTRNEIWGRAAGSVAMQGTGEIEATKVQNRGASKEACGSACHRFFEPWQAL